MVKVNRNGPVRRSGKRFAAGTPYRKKILNLNPAYSTFHESNHQKKKKKAREWAHFYEINLFLYRINFKTFHQNQNSLMRTAFCSKCPKATVNNRVCLRVLSAAQKTPKVF